MCWLSTVSYTHLDVYKRQAQYEQQLAENERLQKVADGGSQEDYIERVAREKLGYVMPDEKVYDDITPGN